MKIAIISDIHGNSYALKETLRIINKEKIKKIFILGDMIGYYYGTDIFEMLENYECEFIAGNHEVMFKKIIDGQLNIKDITKKYGNGMKLFIEKGRKRDHIFISNLEISKTLNINNLKIGLFHGSPESVDEYIYPDTGYEKLKSLNKNNFDFIFLGHTHRPFIFSDKNHTVVNPGSVGQNRLEGGVSSWVILNTENKCVQFMNTKYDISNLVEEIKNDESLYLKEILKRKL